MTVELDLRAYAAAQIAAGHATLAAVPAPQLDGQSVQILRYARAVALHAKAELIERYRDYDLTPAGASRPTTSPRPSASCAAMPSMPCATSSGARAPWST
jgi:hypothetical protein